ncbi:glycoside hydrolase [Paenibacillus hemerocallicola]|uniref:Lysozyme n=1 Tax=Paenibacillus hemerocallicola TaxID=1172614 RepID=A0A5C4TIJ6_9BACL|nr:glycoside hydrolase family 25 protein [Paenibacillus hemerocallicola]TNJ68239.1 glycoside hydrolase [Paenibacillus hemerocallicola]
MQSRNEQNIRIIDVSKWQGVIDWAAVAASGVKGVMIKATEGIGYTDPLFRSHYAGATDAGLAVGFYHYCHPETPNTAAREAEDFLAAVTGLPVTLPYALDVEGEAADLGPSRLTDWCHGWLETVEQRSGHRVMIYSGASFARSYLGSKLARWPLWVAHYKVNQPMANGTWDRWAMFQYSESGRVGGIAGNVDLNEMDLAYWEKLHGTTETAKLKGDDTMQLEQWQWKMLGDSLDGLYRKGLLGDYVWAEKAYKGELMQTELAWLNTVVFAREKGVKM